MAYLRAFGSYLPSRVVDNAEIAPMVGADPEWLLHATGIEQRRFAGPEDSVASLGIAAARDCLEKAAISASEVGMLIVASGSSERRWPGPAWQFGGYLVSSTVYVLASSSSLHCLAAVKMMSAPPSL